MYCEHWGTPDKPQVEYEHSSSIREKVMKLKCIIAA